MCQVFAQQAKGAGVTVNVKVLDATTFNNGFQKWTFSPDFWGTRSYLPQVAQSELKGAPYNECHGRRRLEFRLPLSAGAGRTG